jgi:hypothetical protein
MKAYFYQFPNQANLWRPKTQEDGLLKHKWKWRVLSLVQNAEFRVAEHFLGANNLASDRTEAQQTRSLCMGRTSVQYISNLKSLGFTTSAGRTMIREMTQLIYGASGQRRSRLVYPALNTSLRVRLNGSMSEGMDDDQCTRKAWAFTPLAHLVP